MRSAILTWLAICGLILSAGAGTAKAEDISGTLSMTKTIFENSQLVGDVTCTMTDAPCIEFGASHIRLRLNGFTITGTANPPDDCAPSSAPPFTDAVVVAGREHVAILGPGMVERFRRHGLFVLQSRRVTIRDVTSHHNCFSGIMLNQVTDSRVERNVSVRNAIASGNTPCGGSCLVASHDNWIRWNVFGGNGDASIPVAPGPGSDFGVGLIFGSSGNLLEENSMVGNINGVLLHANTTGNVIRGNIIAGNPPIEVARTFGAAVGTDIFNLSPAGANTFGENLCMTYAGAGPPPCPNIPRFGGHRHALQGPWHRP